MRHISAVLVMVLLLGLGGVADLAAEEEVIAVAGPSLAMTPYFNLPRFAEKHGVKVVTRRIGGYAQVQQALELGAADIGGIGYVNLLQMAVGGGTPKAKAVSGIFAGSQDVVFHKDVKITNWKDVEGKRIARIPGSFAEFLFRVAAAHNGVDLSKVLLRDFGFSYATLNLALQKREVDGLIIWSPGLEMPLVGGFGYLPPISLKDTPIGDINGVLAMSTTLIEKSPALAEKVVRAFVEATQHYAKNPDEWVKAGRALTGAEVRVLEEGAKTTKLTNEMSVDRARTLAKIAFKEKLVTKDASDVIGQWIHYDLLMKATGKSKKELGG